MMRRLFLSLFLLAAVSLTAQVNTPKPSPKSTLNQKVGLTDVTVEYSRPSKKGRVIFGDLVPYNKMWRTGANESTIVTFSDDIVIDNKTLKKGTYALYTKPSANAWDIYFYTETKSWGTPKEWDDAKVALTTSVASKRSPAAVETFTISVDNLKDGGADLVLAWDDRTVSVPFLVPTDDLVESSIQSVMDPKPKFSDYYSAAVYYLSAGKDINKAKTWIDKAVKMTDDKPKFWYIHQQALIHKKAGSKMTARKAALRSLELAKEAKYDAYIKKNEDLLKTL